MNPLRIDEDEEGYAENDVLTVRRAIRTCAAITRRQAKLSGRKVAGLRKQVILSGSTWPFEKERTNWGGMKIADLPKVKQKGHKRDKIRLKRCVVRYDPCAFLPSGQQH